MASFNWLHISDWHEGREELSLNRNVVLSKFKEDLENRAKIDASLEEIDFVFFTGDIAFSGQPQEFQKAKETLIDPMLDILGPSTKMFFVPGNHDLDRKEAEGVHFPSEYNYLISHPDFVSHRDSIEELVSRDDRISVINSTLSAFNSFVTGYCPDFDNTELFHVEKFEKGGTEFAFVGLNTSWPCARSSLSSRSSGETADYWDYGALKITESQIQKSLDRAKPFDIGIAMMHHPLNWLAEYEQAIAEQLITENFDLVLHGHEHRPRINKSASVYGDSVVIPAGALYTRRVAPDPRYRNSYNFGTLDTLSRAGKVYYRAWNEDFRKWSSDERFWKDGKATFLLSSVPEEREKGAREELHELQRQFSPFIKKRTANWMNINIQHTPIEIDGHKLLEVEIGHTIELEPGSPEAFPVATKRNKRVAKLLKERHRDRLYQLVELSPEHSILDSDDELLARAEVQIGPDLTKVTYRYRMLETNEGVMKFTIGRFMRNVKIHLKSSPDHEYEFSNLGGFPSLEPVQDDFFQMSIMETEGLALPLQGYLIQWYPKL